MTISSIPFTPAPSTACSGCSKEDLKARLVSNRSTQALFGALLLAVHLAGSPMLLAAQGAPSDPSTPADPSRPALSQEAASILASDAVSLAVPRIGAEATRSEIERHLEFLTSDELKGRDTGSEGLRIAGAYIASWFRSVGATPAPGQTSYFHSVPLRRVVPPTSGTLTLAGTEFELPSGFIAMNSMRSRIEGPVVVLEHGTPEEIAKAKVEGRIVVVKAGLPGETSPQQWFGSIMEKNSALKAKGALGVIETFDNKQFPWQILVNFLNTSRLNLDSGQAEEDPIPHIWLNATTIDHHAVVAKAKKPTAVLNVEGPASDLIQERNVIAVIEGSDPELKDEYVLLSAHYDHVGINESLPGEDKIYNGARDNGIGTTSVMMAAEYFAAHRPRRSIMLALWTAEEKGLLGSAYFAENPTVDLAKVVYNLNIDGAGYNDTSRVTVIGLGRTLADPHMMAAARAFGLTAHADAAPEQGLFDRSDNVAMARKGIPAPTYSLGFTAFDDEINKYYHQVADDFASVNLTYVTSYLRSFLLAAELIANDDRLLFWNPGDKYEEAGKALYGIKTE